MGTIENYYNMIANGADQNYAYCISLYDYLQINRKNESILGLHIDRVTFYHDDNEMLIIIIDIIFSAKEEERNCISYKRNGIIHLLFYNNHGSIFQEQLIEYMTPDLPVNGSTSALYESEPFEFKQPLENIQKIVVSID